MSYLFDRIIEPAANAKSPKPVAGHLRDSSQQVTQQLIKTNPRTVNRGSGAPTDDDRVAADLVNQMGSQIKTTSPHAQDYVDNWRQVSGNAGTVRAYVSRELDHAYQIGLDITAPAVIGKMFYLAVMIWSELGDYTSPTQDEGRR